MTTPDSLRRHFDSRAGHYDNPLTAFIGERELRVIRHLVPPASAVLDYGCGAGRAALDHARRGCAVTAYDLSPAMLALAQRKARRLGLSAEFTADLNRLAGRRWPVVTCLGVLDYYPDPVPLLRALRNYLAPAGRLIVTYPNALSPLGWAYALASRLTYPCLPRTPAFARRAAMRAGYTVVSLRYAFPSFRPFGHTLVLELERQGKDGPAFARS